MNDASPATVPRPGGRRPGRVSRCIGIVETWRPGALILLGAAVGGVRVMLEIIVLTIQATRGEPAYDFYGNTQLLSFDSMPIDQGAPGAVFFEAVEFVLLLLVSGVQVMLMLLAWGLMIAGAARLVADPIRRRVAT